LTKVIEKSGMRYSDLRNTYICCDLPRDIGQDICYNKPESTYG